MTQSALTTIQNVAMEINLQRPSAITVGSQSLEGRAFQILQTACKRLAKKNWPELLKEYEFHLVKNEPWYDLPDDYDRFVNDTGWDRVESRPLGVLSPQQWQEWKSGLVRAEIWKQYRVKAEDGQRKLFINPTPSTTSATYETRDGVQVRVGLVIEYYSNQWAEDASGNPLSAMTASSDVIRLPADVVEAELKWRWLRSLNRPYLDERIEAEQLCNVVLAQSGTPTTISAGGGKKLPYPNIPETNVGLS